MVSRILQVNTTSNTAGATTACVDAPTELGGGSLRVSCGSGAASGGGAGVGGGSTGGSRTGAGTGSGTSGAAEVAAAGAAFTVLGLAAGRVMNGGGHGEL